MLVPVPPEGRPALRSLFENCIGLHGCVDAALDGAMGEVWAGGSPASVVLARFDFYYLAGDATAPEAEEAVQRIGGTTSIVISNGGWLRLLRRHFGEKLTTRTRVAFADPGDWDRDRLRSFLDAIPEGYELRRITLLDSARFRDLADSLVYNFASLEDFVERGVGFGIEHEGRYVSGCSSFAISPQSLEFEIQTHPDFQRRGLATASASAMILHCLDVGLEPCWDAHNPISAALATKLGFVKPAPYTAYEVGLATGEA
jgi:RimJ/RimL family protein N-acetyltransferase